MSQSVSTYHIVLIGIDAYPPEYRSLQGCVNDIDAIESLLHEACAEHSHRLKLQVTRLAAPHRGTVSSTRYASQTLAPTKANIVRALQLVRDKARPGDRALIFYSGHGYYLRWEAASTWHEALVPSDLRFLYDVEVNKLVADIADRLGGDLTLVLDCCHSAGEFRDFAHNSEHEVRSARFLERSDPDGMPPSTGAPPDMSILAGRGAGAGHEDAPASKALASEHSYIVVAACQAVEEARERPMQDGRYYGLLTYALVASLRSIPRSKWAKLRWMDVWPDLLDQVEKLGRIAPRRPQHPWLVGRPERRVFGGAWQKQEMGLPVRKGQAGLYEIGAGSLMGLSLGAELAVYGSIPDRFPPVGTVADYRARAGLLRVVDIGSVSCLAEVVQGMEVPSREGGGGLYRGRLVKAGESPKLVVSLDPPEPAVVRFLEQSDLLQVAGARVETRDAEVQVKGTKDTGWTIGDEVTAEIACVPSGELGSLRAGLIHYARFREPLRLATRAAPGLGLGVPNPLEVALLDCAELQGLKPGNDPHDPPLPMLPVAGASSYILPAGTRFCVRLRNNYEAALFVSVLDCEAYGRIDFMGELAVRPNDQQVLWQNDRLWEAWELQPSKQTGEPGRSSTDRLVIIATTRPGVQFHYLSIDRSIQQSVSEATAFRGPGESTGERLTGTELWWAQVILVRIVA